MDRRDFGPNHAAKGWTGAVVTILSWALPTYTVVDPPVFVWTAVLTVLIWAVPNDWKDNQRLEP